MDRPWQLSISDKEFRPSVSTRGYTSGMLKVQQNRGSHLGGGVAHSASV